MDQTGPSLKCTLVKPWKWHADGLASLVWIPALTWPMLPSLPRMRLLQSSSRSIRTPSLATSCLRGFPTSQKCAWLVVSPLRSDGTWLSRSIQLRVPTLRPIFTKCSWTCGMQREVMSESLWPAYATREELQWVKKLSQYLAVSQRLTWNKSRKIANNLKIIYAIV